MHLLMRKDLTLIRSRIERALRLLTAQKKFRARKWEACIKSNRDHRAGIILVYHRVNRLPRSGFCPTRNMSVDTDDFDKQLHFLRQHFSILRLEDMIDCLQNSKELPKNFAVITFDDGYEDNYTDAYPLLEKYQIPATIFLTTGMIDRSALLWHDQLEILLSETASSVLIFEDKQGIRKLSLRTVGAKYFAYEYLTNVCLELFPSEREEFLNQLAGILKVKVHKKVSQSYKLLNWNQVRTIKSKGLVDFGSHTMRHQVVDRLDGSLLTEELEGSQKAIIRELGNRAKLFAYPNGNFLKDLGKYLQSLSYCGACTIEAGLVSKYCDPYFLPRIGVTGMTLEGLVLKISDTMARGRHIV